MQMFTQQLGTRAIDLQFMNLEEGGQFSFRAMMQGPPKGLPNAVPAEGLWYALDRNRYG